MDCGGFEINNRRAGGRGPGDCTPTVAFPGKGGSAQKEGTFFKASSIVPVYS